MIVTPTQERLGHLLAPVERPESVDPSRTYRLLGARWYAQGLFVKDEKSGQNIKANILYRVKTGDFVYNRLFAWKGSFAIAGDEADECYVSNEFPCFAVNRERLDPSYLKWWFSRESTWLRALGLSSGATPTSRNRLKEQHLLGLGIPLPPLTEQRRIVARIEELAEKVREAQSLRESAVEEMDAHWPATLKRAFDGTFARRVAAKVTAPELLKRSATLHVGYQASNNNNAYPHKPQVLEGGPYTLPAGWCWTTLGSVLTHMVDCVNDTPNFAEVDTGLIGLKTNNIRPYRLDLTRRWFVTPEDFVTWNRRTTPQAGDFVLTREAPVGHACLIPDGVSVCLTQRLMLLRAENRTIQSRYLLHFLNSPCFTDQIAVSGRGQTHPHIRVGDAPHFLLPLAPLEHQIEIVAELDALQSKLDSVNALQSETAAELDAMLPAILDKAFKGEL